MSKKKKRSTIGEEEKQQFMGGLKRLTDKGVPIYVDGKESFGPLDWERLFEVREDKMFYMGDYVQSETGVLKEVRFDKVYLSDTDVHAEKKNKKEK